MQNALPIEVWNAGATHRGYFCELNAPIEFSYQVTLDNGYVNVFFIHHDNGRWCEAEKGYTPLAVEVGGAIEEANEQLRKAKLCN